MYNLFVYVGLRHLRMKPIRSLLTTLGVALGVALFIGIEIINRSTLASFRENVEAVAGKAALSVSAGESGFPEDRLVDIQKVMGVKNAAPLIEARGYFAGNSPNKAGSSEPADSSGSAQTMMILGVDLLKEQSVRTYRTTGDQGEEQTIDDPLVFLNQPDSIIITREFARNHGYREGSTFVLATTRGTQKFTVRGLLSPVGAAKAYGGAIAIMDIDGARMSFGKEGKIDRVDIVVREGASIQEVSERLRKVLGSGYTVERSESRSETMERMVKSYQTMMTFFSSLALFVGLFLVTNSISISVVERRKEIGTLRAMGATRKAILTLFLSESVAMGATGALLGSGMGRALASVLVDVASKSMTSRYLTPIQVSHLKFGVHEVLQAVALGAVASLVAALWPAYRAASIQPLEAMKRQEVNRRETGVGFGESSRKKFQNFRLRPLLALSMLAFSSLSYWMQWPRRFGFIENLNQFCSIVGATLLAPTIVNGLIRVFRPISVPLGGAVTRLAQDNLIRNPKRTGSNVMSLMVGLMLVVMISCVNLSFEKTLMDWFVKVLHFDLVVSSNGQVLSYQMQPIEERLGRDLQEVPGVKRVSKNGLTGLRFVHMRYGGKQVAVRAYDEPDPELHYSNLDLIDRPAAEAGKDLYHSSTPVLLISENFALHFQKKTGDTIELESPGGIVSFKIIGVLTDFASDVGVLYMSRDVYKEIWKDTLVSAFGIQVMPGFDIEKVRHGIIDRVGPTKNLLVTSNRELRKQMVEMIDQSFTDSKTIEFAALLVGLLGLLNTLLISVMERMRELGILRAVGMSRKQVKSMIFQEALLQGGLGALAAVLLGGWVAYVWITYSFSYVLGWLIHFHFPWASIFTTVTIGLGVAWLAGIYPARRAAHLEITEALDYD